MSETLTGEVLLVLGWRRSSLNPTNFSPLPPPSKQGQEWESLSGSLWLKHSLDLLLALLVERKPVELAPNLAVLLALLPSSHKVRATDDWLLTDW